MAYGGWAIDLHPPRGIDEVGQPPFTPTNLGSLYTIPLRALFSRNVPNLLFAGRNVSATHVAFASTRVMATCAAMGQAIGTAAAVAVEKGLSLSALAGTDAVRALQQRLLKDDAYLLDVRNEDAADLARTAAVLVEEGDNFQRKRVYRLPAPAPVPAASLRVEIVATHGIPRRVFLKCAPTGNKVGDYVGVSLTWRVHRIEGLRPPNIPLEERSFLQTS